MICIGLSLECYSNFGKEFDVADELCKACDFHLGGFVRSIIHIIQTLETELVHGICCNSAA